MPITLVLADDHPLILSGLEQVLSPEKGFRTLALCADGHETLEAVGRHQPDVLVLDLCIPPKDGLAVMRELRTAALSTRVVVLTAAQNQEMVIEAMYLGARGVVLKQMAPRLLIECIRKVHAGGEWLETRAVGRILEHFRQRETRNNAGVLTRRELDVARMVARGLNNETIAEKLSMGEGTVKVHLHHIYEKLELDGRSALLIYGREQGWV